MSGSISASLDPLIRSFSSVPPISVPAIIECVLASSMLSVSNMLSFLLQSFTNFEEANEPNFILCYTNALCHLIKKDRAPADTMNQFFSTFFIPLLKVMNPSNLELLKEIENLVYPLVLETESWDLIDKTLVPFCLGSVGYLRMGTTLEDDIDASKHFTDNSSKPLGTLPGKAALRIFISLLDFCLKNWRGLATSKQKILKKFGSLHAFTVNLTRQMSNLALLLLKLSVENRFNAIHLILPSVLGSLNMLSAFKVLEHETQISISQISIYRACFLEKMWSCCHSLFQLGEFERRDAYRILSLYFSSFYDFVGGEKNAEIIDESFDFRGNAVIWEQTKIGLVDRNSSVRKMALYILKSLIDYHSFSVLHGNNQHFFTSQQPIVDAKNVANSLHDSLTKREKWAEKEAKSLGVGEISHSDGICLNGAERWKVFIMLYEMLDEYGTHLVEAAWTHQVSLLFQFWPLNQGSTTNSVYCAPMDTLEGVLCWLTVLWERGFLHENPEVRRLIMHSFLSIDWNIYENHAQKVPKSFILGSLVRGLNDAVHHKGFGLKGIYMSGTIEGASQYFRRISNELSVSERATLAWSLASAARHESFCRPGLMALAFCISSVACHTSPNDKKEKQIWGSSCGVELVDSNVISTVRTSAVELLEAFKLVISRSKQHFNSNYRQLVSEQILKAASSLINVHEVSLEVFLHFISVFPREFVDGTGPLRPTLQAWITKRNFEDEKNKIIDCRAYLLKNLLCFPSHFIKHSFTSDDFVSFDDGDVEAWLVEVHRWAWMLFLVIRDENLAPMFELLQSYCCKLCKDSSSNWVPIKLLILLLCLNEESQIVWKKYVFQDETMAGTEPIWRNLDESSIVSSLDASKKITGELLLLVDEVVAYARLVLTKFWSNSIAKDIEISSSVRGKLGGPAQRRFDSSTTTSVLNFIVAMRTIASMVSICSHTKGEVLNSSLAFSWEFVRIAVQIQPYKSEIGSELFLAVYEALAYVLKALSANFGPLDFYLLTDKKSEFPNGDGKPLLDHLFLCFLNGINDFLANGLLTRSRRAVLLDWKWNCLHSLLSIPCNALEKGIHREDAFPFFSRSIIQGTLIDICDSLETGGENSILFMLRSVKLALSLLYSSKVDPPVSSFNGVNSQIMFQLAKSAWVLHLSCNKRRVAPIAALLSAVLHEPVFGDLKMHEMDANEKGPLKWFIENVIHEGTKSPRTMRLLALHLTGLWLLHPITLKYYIKELKLLSLYGSVAFDEDFEAELRENQEAKIEVSWLAQSPDPELTEVFINTEMYARVSVAVLFYKLYLFIKESKKFEKENFAAVLHCGKTFLLELLDSVVNDSDLSKELYKKFSGVHRRKVRAWQMVCILSHFVEEDIVENVTFNLHICLYRNNLPAVRQYLETFAIQIYLKFPNLAEEQLIPIFYDYKMRPQALSSYVFIAANVIIHSTELPVQMKHLDNLLPPVIPFLTSHHHSLRCFTQLLVYHVLCKLWPAVRVCKPGFKPLEKRCFEDLRSYLAGNADCLRMRASMEGFLVNFDPVASATPAGIFNTWSEGSDFECVPVSLMDLVMAFLNNVRDELRYSYAMNEETLKNENFSGNGTSDDASSLNELPRNHSLRDSSLDFQKKITLHGYERQAAYDNQCFLKSSKISTIFSELEVEDEFLSLAIHERKEVLDKTRESRQQIILVASLLDRIPNLAGLARTCEVFKAACLAIADSSIMEDKQFQLISVTAEKWVPIIEVPINCIKVFLEKKRKEGFSILGLEQTANSTELNKFAFPNKTVLVLGREKEGIPVDIIHDLDGCIEIPQLGVIRSLNVHVSGAIALWEYTRQQRCKQQ